MKTTLRVQLNASPADAAKLRELQATFAQACNVLSPLVQKTRVWNRVALHHMAYKQLRERFPQMGSQMVCNAIYSVSRHSRMIYQGAGSPFNVAQLGDKPLPLLQFDDTCPVYFDRHTLSVKDGRLSMYTLDGRMHFDLDLGADNEANFREKKLREIVLRRTSAEAFELAFVFSDKDDEEPNAPAAEFGMQVPDYMMVEPAREST
jgi:hypothetical protein